MEVTPDPPMRSVYAEVFVTTRFAALHSWPDAPDVAYWLRHPHRHEFHVRVACAVSHADRDIEFITLKGVVESMLAEYPPAWSPKGDCIAGLRDIGHRSCEHVAEELVELLQSDGFDVAYVEVSEDGENGAVASPLSRDFEPPVVSEEISLLPVGTRVCFCLGDEERLGSIIKTPQGPCILSGQDVIPLGHALHVVVVPNQP